MIAPRTFIDTNVLVYAVDAADPRKRAQATAALSGLGGGFVVSSQVLGEFWVTVNRKVVMTPHEASDYIADLSERHVVVIDVTLVRAAIETSQRAQISYWDALIVEAAVRGGCSQILSEDLNAGQVIRGVEIVNPFA